MAFARSGAFSMMLRYSSPCSRPEAMACVSWYMAEDCSCVDAPPMVKFLFISSVKAIISSLLLNASPASRPSLEIVAAVSV